MSDLEPMPPRRAMAMYEEARRDELTENTLEGQHYRIEAFVSWCEDEGIENLNVLTGRHLYEYRIWRREGGYSGEEIKTVTLRNDLTTVRAFLRFCGDVEAVPPELFDQIPLPRLDGSGDVSETTLVPDRAVEILDYLGRYQYASRTHIVMLLLWRTGCRISALRALDLQDVDGHGDRPGADGPAIEVVHRPDAGTPLKNKGTSERWNTIAPSTAAAIEDYVAGPREDVVDEHGREPLVTTRNGRISRSAVRDALYKISRPCWRGEECPHGEDPETCEFTEWG